MNLKTLIVGELKTNCYIIEKGNSCIIIDPGAQADLIMQNVNPNKMPISKHCSFVNLSFSLVHTKLGFGTRV